MNTDFIHKIPTILLALCFSIVTPTTDAGFLDELKSSVEAAGKKVANDVIKKTMGDDDEEDDEDEDGEYSDSSTAQPKSIFSPKPVKNTSKVSVVKTDSHFRGIKIGVVELCGDNRSALKALRGAGHEPGRFPEKSMNESRYSVGARNTHKSDGKYNHDYLNIFWKKRKIISVTYRRAGENAYANLFDAERRRIERQANIKFTCKKNTKQHECVYRVRETGTNVRIYKSFVDKQSNSVVLNARSNCKSSQSSPKRKTVKQAKPVTPGSMTLKGNLTGKILIKRPWNNTRKGQFGNKFDDYALFVYVSGVKVPPGSPRCGIFIYDEFHKRGNLSRLELIKKEFHAMKGHKVELGNVRIGVGASGCAFSKLRSISAPAATKMKVATNSKPVAKKKSVTVISKFAGVKVKGVKLCGTLEQAAMTLKRQGYFKGQSDSTVKSNAKNNMLRANKTVAGVKYRFMVMAVNNKGLVETISYKAVGLADSLTPFEKANNDFEQHTGLRPGCSHERKGTVCQYTKNDNTVNFIRFSQKPELRLNAVTNCAK